MSSQEFPFVTLIMAIRNEEDFIERCLGAIFAQDYPGDKINILIADGMSDDNTIKVIQAMPDAERVQIVPNPEHLQSYGLNRLIPLATGDYIVRIDGHTIIAADYVSQCVQTLQETDADNVCGAMDPIGITPVGAAIAVAGKSRFAVPTTFHVSKTPQFTDTVYLGAWHRRVFENVGLFSTDVLVNEDYEFNYRIRANGGKIFFTPAIKSIYYGRQTWAHLAKQYYRYGRSKVRMLRKYPKSLRLRQTVAPLFVAGLVGGIVLALISHLFAWIYVAVISLYFLLALIFAMRASNAEENHPAIWRVILVFVVMHITWGLGFWRELIKPDSR